MLTMFKTPMLLKRQDVQKAQNAQDVQKAHNFQNAHDGCSNGKMFKMLMMFYKLAMFKAGPVMQLFILPIK